MTNDDRTFGGILQSRARRQPDETAYIYLKGGELDEITVTYGQLDRQARTIAAAIQRACRPGDRAILLYPPGLDFLAAFFACLYAGVIAVPAYPPKANRNMSRLRAIVDDCQATIALSTEQIAPSIRALGLGHVIATDTLDGALASEWQKPAALDEKTLAFLQYTSGSTGTPRGVMVSHGNLLHNSKCIQERWGHSPSSVGVCWVPQFHDLGLIIGNLQPLYVGYKAVLMSPTAFVLKPYRWLQAISHYRGTTTCGPNFSFDLCVSKITPEQRRTLDLSSLDIVMNGAEPVLRATLMNFAHAFTPCGFDIRAFRGGYGLAEGTVFVTTGHPLPEGPNVKTLSKSALEQHRVCEASKQDARDIVGCGPSAGDHELVIVHPELHTRCKPDQIGEIWIKGPSVAQGYWQRPEESERTFQAFLDDTKEGPFLRTGDLGFLHDHELYITGRTKDLIIVRGRNHYPQDIERTVERVHSALKLHGTAAFSLRDPRDAREERVVVVQELRRDITGVDLDSVAADIFRAVAEEHELSLHAVLLIADGTISKTSSGKIQRNACRQRYEEGSFSIVHQATFAISSEEKSSNRTAFLQRFYQLDAEECRAQVELYLIQVLRSIRHAFFYIDVHEPLVKMGLDSLGVAELKTAIEEDLGVALPIPTLMDASLRAASEDILQQLNAMPNEPRKGRVALSDEEMSTLLDDMRSHG